MQEIETFCFNFLNYNHSKVRNFNKNCLQAPLSRSSRPTPLVAFSTSNTLESSSWVSHAVNLEAMPGSGYYVHPASLQSAISLVMISSTRGHHSELRSLDAYFLPNRIESHCNYAANNEGYLKVRFACWLCVLQSPVTPPTSS